jgi:ferric-dicitrate binding protein FerR (iron transport regulator)
MDTDHISTDHDLLLRCFSGQATPEERAAAEEWIAASDKNRRTAQQVYYLQHAGETLHAMRTIDVDAGWAAVMRKIRRLHHSPLLPALRVAAVFCLFLMTAMAYLIMQRVQEQRLAGITAEAPEGSISSVVLPDSSKVWLNAGSRIVYGQGYGSRHRRLTLTGEAFFEVRSNKDLPLEVETASMRIYATGTKFNVKAYPEENTVSATLTEGTVHVTTAADKKTITLKPGQMAVLDKSSRQMSVRHEVKTVLHTSWKERHWSIEGVTLGELAPALQRRYAVKVVFDSEALKAYKFRGEIPLLNIEQMAKALQLTVPLNYRMSNDTLHLSLDIKRKLKYDKIIK